ncbi:unnamed protein product [Eruca vesicaria subsp. sativa]|uniref:Uncharacterized protein n=1 Tax=Eruca vesicaria subsp. sativa TaxID=29727 RepID=A0ABC8JUU8_ERUVS|nr:unnamed protein product [Eruca vesicaria subsp. sativa]
MDLSCTILGGSLLYVLTDYQFTITAYSWAVAYLVCMSIDLVYIKDVVTNISHEITDKPDWYTLPVVVPVGLYGINTQL